MKENNKWACPYVPICPEARPDCEVDPDVIYGCAFYEQFEREERQAVWKRYKSPLTILEEKRFEEKLRMEVRELLEVAEGSLPQAELEGLREIAQEDPDIACELLRLKLRLYDVGRRI